MTSSRSRLALTLAAGAFLPFAMYAQQSTGSLSGRITASDGVTPKSGVIVSVIQKGTNLTRKATSDSEGNWRAPALPVGDYRIILEAGGQSQTINRTVQLGMDTLVRFKWPAEAGAVVVVEALATGVDQLNTTSAEIGVNVDSQVLANLPILDRNVNSAAVLAPGVQVIAGSQVDPTKKTSTYIVSGDGQGRGTNFNVDGADNNSSDVGGSVMPVPFDAIDQFQVLTNQYKAEFGRSNAGFLNVVTKSGGNEFAGSASMQWTNQAMRARKTDEGNKLDNDQKVYAVMVSGPIIKDKLFYMVAGEKTVQEDGQIFDPRAVAAIPALGSENTETHKMNLYAKMDWNISQVWLASFKYGRYYDTSANQAFPHTAAVGGYVDPSMLGTNRDSTSTYGAKLTGTFGNVVWESTYNHFDYINSIRPSNMGPNNGTSLEVRNRFEAQADSWRRGQDPNAYQNTGVKRTQWKNELTYTLPEHNIKGGFDWQKTDYPLETYFYPTATAYVVGLSGVSFANAFSPTVTPGTNLATYDKDGNVTGYSSANEVTRVYLATPMQNPATSFKGYGIYLQDDWTVNNNWNVYYGYRLDWDTQLDYYNQFDGLYAQMHAANPLLAGIGTQAPRTHHYGSPRIQVLYKPNGDDILTFKLGYGKFVASTIDNVVGFSRGLNAPVNGLPNGYVYNDGTNFLKGSTFTTVNGTPIVLPADMTPYNYANNVNGLADLFSKTINGSLTPASFNTGGKNLLASNFSYPTSQTVTLGMTYKFNERSALDLTLLYSQTKNLTVQFTTDGSSAAVWSPTTLNPGAYSSKQDDNGDNIFMSNQSSSQKQLQVKYTYTTSKMSFLMTFVAKDIRSSNGGDGGAFSNSGAADFYGSGAQYLWIHGPERPATGTEALSGSFSWNYNFDFGTKISFLGQWHSGMYYDQFVGGTIGANADNSNPNPVAGIATGDWNLDVGFRISHLIKFGTKMTLEPFIQVQNILNNYDYGTNYQNQVLDPKDSTHSADYINPTLGQRLGNFQANSPRTAAIGARFTF